MQRISLSSIDRSFVPRAREGLGTIRRQDELLVFGNDDVAVLNGTASLIWQACDGDRSIADLAEVFARRFQAPVARIEGDVIRTVRNFASRGLLAVPPDLYEVVEHPEDSPPPWHVKVRPP